MLILKFWEFLTFDDGRNVKNRGKPVNTEPEAADQKIPTVVFSAGSGCTDQCPSTSKARTKDI